MNNINKVFNDIKASEELKEKVYNKIKNIKSKRNNIKVVTSLSLALTSILLFFLVYSYNEKPSDDTDKDMKIMLTESMPEDKLFYDGYTYVADNSFITEDMLDKKIGTLKQNDTIVDNFSSNNHDKASLYTIKDIKDYSKLAVVDNDNIIVFIKISE